MNSIPSARRRGAHRLRRGRVSLGNQVYHVSSATSGRDAIFRDLVCGRAVIAAIRRESLVNHVVTLAFVVMPDHLHWLLQLPERRQLSVCVNNVKSLSARRINRLRNRRGRVWQKGFYDRALRADEDLVAVARYIVANPLRAGIVDDVRQYPHWDAVWVGRGFRLG